MSLISLQTKVSNKVPIFNSSGKELRPRGGVAVVVHRWDGEPARYRLRFEDGETAVLRGDEIEPVKVPGSVS